MSLIDTVFLVKNIYLGLTAIEIWMIVCILFVFGALIQYGSVLIYLKIIATHKNHRYFTDKCLYGCIPVANLTTAIMAVNDKEIMQDNITHIRKVRKAMMLILLK